MAYHESPQQSSRQVCGVEVSRMFSQLHETGKHACGKEKDLWWPWPPESFVSQILSLNQEGLDSVEPGKDLAGQVRGRKDRW